MHLSALPVGIKALAAAADREGHGHVTRLVADFDTGENRFAQTGEALFAAYVGKHLVGVGGVNQDPYAQHQRAGRIRRVYIHPDYRRQGLASALLTAIERHASRYFETLNLFTDSEQASNFYLRLGYRGVCGINKISHTKTIRAPRANAP